MQKSMSLDYTRDEESKTNNKRNNNNQTSEAFAPQSLSHFASSFRAFNAAKSSWVFRPCDLYHLGTPRQLHHCPKSYLPSASDSKK